MNKHDFIKEAKQCLSKVEQSDSNPDTDKWLLATLVHTITEYVRNIPELVSISETEDHNSAA